MKIIINGHATHGKDYLAAAVAKKYGLRYYNASMWFAEKVLIPAYPGMWPCTEACYLDRVNYRDLWYQMMRLGDWQERFMQHSDIFCGHRNIEEHQEMVSHLNPRTIWVHNSKKGPESASSSQWQTDSLITSNHDMVLMHEEDGTDKMLNQLEEYLKPYRLEWQV